MNGHNIILPRWARLEVFFYRLGRAPPATNHDDALRLLTDLLHGVEEEFSGVAYNPTEPGDDGRMYPPNLRFLTRRAAVPGVRVYRQRGHSTAVADNGAIEIRLVQAEPGGAHEYTVFEKPGSDGRKVSNYAADSKADGQSEQGNPDGESPP